MSIRLATAADIETIVKMRIEMLHEVAELVPEELEAAVYEYLKTHIPNKSCICALLEKDDCIAAKAMLCRGESVPDEINTAGSYAILASVYTRPNFRGQGLMEQLLKYLLEQGREAGIMEVYASAEEKAIPLYLRLGFQRAENQMIAELATIS